MLTPDGQLGDNSDKVMLLSRWTNTLSMEGTAKELIRAGMGKPTFPINIHTVEMYLEYWKYLEQLLLDKKAIEDEMIFAAIDYGDPRGDEDPRKMMAQSMSNWYDTLINEENILFTVGGAGALRVIFETFNELNKSNPTYRVLTPFPHYGLYADNQHILHPIDVMAERGYRLTGRILETSIIGAYKAAEKDGNEPQCLLLSNPSNPLGTVISEDEWQEITEVLRKYPKIKIIIDEAYAELSYVKSKIPSILKIAPDLKERIIILRSATKAFSAAGERMAMLMAFDPELMSRLLNKNISSIGHAPRSAQRAYAYTMAKFDHKQHLALCEYYKPKTEYVLERLKKMNASLPDSDYKIEGSFYVMADLSDLMGISIPTEAVRAIGHGGIVRTSEELAYSLLFQESIMVAPAQYFGLNPKNGYIRITCSGSFPQLKELMDRLENCLLVVRKARFYLLNQNIESLLKQIQNLDQNEYEILLNRYNLIPREIEDCGQLFIRNKELMQLLSNIKVKSMKLSESEQNKAARTLQTFFNNIIRRRTINQRIEAQECKWKEFVESIATSGPLRKYLLNLSKEHRHTFKPWVDYLKEIELKSEVEDSLDNNTSAKLVLS